MRPRPTLDVTRVRRYSLWVEGPRAEVLAYQTPRGDWQEYPHVVASCTSPEAADAALRLLTT